MVEVEAVFLFGASVGEALPIELLAPHEVVVFVARVLVVEEGALHGRLRVDDSLVKLLHFWVLEGIPLFHHQRGDVRLFVEIQCLSLGHQGNLDRVYVFLLDVSQEGVGVGVYLLFALRRCSLGFLVIVEHIFI